MEVQGESCKRVLNCIFILAFVGLLILRFPLLILPKFITIGISGEMVTLLFQDGTYVLTALMILLVKDRLANYKFNLLALVIFIMAPLLNAFVNIAFGKRLFYNNIQYSKFQIAVSIILCIVLIASHAKVHKEGWLYYVKWILASVVIGVLLGIAIGLIYSHFQTRSQSHASGLLVIFCFATQLANAAALEEPIFRGFLWGCLESKGWKQVWIWLLQAVLFCAGHAYYLPENPVFFVGTFVTALIFGLLVWKSRSVGTSMIVHGFGNSIADIVMHYII